MLLESLHYVKKHGGDEKLMLGKLFGQEKNLTTSAIARMNLFLHGAEDFHIERGDTLPHPAFYSTTDSLQVFDCVIANPPFSLQKWGDETWLNDPYGRNFAGLPPSKTGDYAWIQHMIKSMAPKTGRCAILFPHDVLFRNEEAEMRAKLIAHDVVECVLGLGPNLFYNSLMEACVVICRTSKSPERRNKVLFVNAVNEVTRERAQSFLTDEHINKIVDAYQQFEEIEGFSRVAGNDEIREKGNNLSILLYVRLENRNSNTKGPDENRANANFKQTIAQWQESSQALKTSITGLLDLLHETTKHQNYPKSKGTAQPAFKRAVLAAEITAQLYLEPTFGSVKQEKVIFICEKHLGLTEELEHHHLRQAAGPYDPKAKRSVEANFKR